LALRTGVVRGWIQLRNMLTTPDGVYETLIWNGIPLLILILNRNATAPGTSLPLATVAMPGFLGLMVVSAAMSVAYYLSLEREDGTLLRAKATPNGMTGYVAGLITMTSLETMLGLLFVLIPSLFLFDGLVIAGLGRGLTLLWVLALGLLATVPLGFVIGSVVRSARAVGGIGLMVIGGLATISGIFIPLQQFPGWVQGAAQALPAYWVGMGMRSVFLPDAAVAWELTGSWRHLEAVGVLGAWAVVNLALAPVMLRRMARRESGSSVEIRRQKALQRVA
jgi:ABC-2 type transport system permease protein